MSLFNLTVRSLAYVNVCIIMYVRVMHMANYVLKCSSYAPTYIIGVESRGALGAGIP